MNVIHLARGMEGYNYIDVFSKVYHELFFACDKNGESDVSITNCSSYRILSGLVCWGLLFCFMVVQLVKHT